MAHEARPALAGLALVGVREALEGRLGHGLDAAPRLAVDRPGRLALRAVDVVEAALSVAAGAGRDAAAELVDVAGAAAAVAQEVDLDLPLADGAIELVGAAADVA